MLPSIPPDSAPAPDSDIGTGTACRDLDGLLFTASGWFAIDASNVRVSGVTPATLDQALDLVGRGRVATIVGRLRPGVAGIDVDAGGALGDEVAHALRDWCAARGVWHLLRPSGGGPGRWHLFTVPGVHTDALADYIAQLRRELRLTAKQLDPRTQLRPLSAPHRRTGALPLTADLDRALTALRGALEPIPDRVQSRRRLKQLAVSSVRTAGGPDQPLTPLPRPHRDLRPAWAAYLARGRRAAAAIDPYADRDPDTRSQIELSATFELVTAGYTELQAWNAITTAHPSAFPKARSRGRRWWWYTWNRCVADADTWLRARRSTAAATPITALPATGRARAALEDLWRSWPTRTRHTDVEIYTVVLARMDRVGVPAVAIPQRDLLLDCAVASRTTVRAALTRLQAAGLLEVLPTYQPGTTDTAHTLALPDLITATGGSNHPDLDASVTGSTAVSVNDPSRCQPPQRPRPLPPLPLRRALGLATCAVLAAVRANAHPLTLPQLVRAAGLLDPHQGAPTRRQLRTARGHLTTLASHGLVHVDEHGGWHAVEADVYRAGDLDRHGQALADTVRERVDAERAVFRERMNDRARRGRWEAQRDAALARAAKAALAAQKAWWRKQLPEYRRTRSARFAAAYTALSPTEQADQKHAIAQRRARAGQNERERYDAWLTALDPADLEQRSIARAVAFGARPRHDQQQLVAAWAGHRARWRLPHHDRRVGDHPRRAATSTTPACAPEEALLRRPSPDIDDLALFSLDESFSTTTSTSWRRTSVIAV